MPKQHLIWLMLCAISFGGCHRGHFMHRKFNCPTDICRTLLCCTGEDPEFHCPCEPSQPFYGYKPTCWGVWPTSGAAWRDAHCGSPSAGCAREHQEFAPVTVAPIEANDASRDSGGESSDYDEGLPPLLMPDATLPLPTDAVPQAPSSR